MSLENANFIDGLVSTNPVAVDPLSQADDHIRLLKSTVKATFPNVTGAITSNHSELNTLDGYTGTTADFNYLVTLNATGVTDTEYSYLSGATSNLQAQISGISTTLVSDPSPTLAADLDTDGNAITFGSWTISIDGSNNLSFAYAGDVKLVMTAAGALQVEDDITAFAGI